MALKLQPHSKYRKTSSSFSFPCICLSFTLLSIIFLSFFFLFFIAKKQQLSYNQFLQTTNYNSIKVYVSDIPRFYNYDLINQYWSSTSPDSRLPSDPDHQIRHSPVKYPPYPVNPLIKQYSAEYWIMGDLETPEIMLSNSFAKRVFNAEEADVVFVPFFATLSAEMELAKGKNTFKKKGQWNEDHRRQKDVIELSPTRWLGRGLVVKITSLCSLGGVVQEKLWDLLVNEAGVVTEEGFHSATGREQSIRGMRSSEFCLHPAGDTPTSCQLFYASQSLCIPVIVSDNIELPFEGMVDYSEFSVFVAVRDALTSNWLLGHLISFSKVQR